MKGWQPEVKNQQQFETITLYLVKEIVFFSSLLMRMKA
jgi:hypothetical protein